MQWTEFGVNPTRISHSPKPGLQLKFNLSVIFVITVFYQYYMWEVNITLPHSDRLWARRPRFHSRQVERFLFSPVSRPSLEPNHPPIKCETESFFHLVTAAGVWSWPINSQYGSLELVEVYHNPPNVFIAQGRFYILSVVYEGENNIKNYIIYISSYLFQQAISVAIIHCYLTVF